MGLRQKASIALIAAVTVFVSARSVQGALQIEKAYFGAEGSWRDITAFLRSQVKDGTLSVSLSQPFEEIGGDPAFGRGKHLLVDYRLDGKPCRVLLEEEYPVAFTITLPSPDAAPPGADARAAALVAEAAAKAEVVPYPVPGAEQQRAPVTRNLVIALVILLLTFAGSVLAVVLAFVGRPGRLKWPALLGITASLVGTMGLIAWTPFGSFPEIGYTWSNGAFEVSFRSGWLFVAPLVLGIFSLLLAMRKHRKQDGAA